MDNEDTHLKGTTLINIKRSRLFNPKTENNTQEGSVYGFKDLFLIIKADQFMCLFMATPCWPHLFINVTYLY